MLARTASGWDGKIYFDSLRRWEPLQNVNVNGTQITFFRPQAGQPYNGVLFNLTNMGGSFSGAYQWKAWRGAAPQPSPPQPGPPPPATTQAPSPPPPQQAPPPAPAPPAPRQVKAVRDVPSGFIQNQQHAAQQCPNNCQRNGGGQWNGQWKMVRAGRHNVHVCSCNFY